MWNQNKQNEFRKNYNNDKKMKKKVSKKGDSKREKMRALREK